MPEIARKRMVHALKDKPIGILGMLASKVFVYWDQGGGGLIGVIGTSGDLVIGKTKVEMTLTGFKSLNVGTISGYSTYYWSGIID